MSIFFYRVFNYEGDKLAQYKSLANKKPLL